MKWHHQRNPAPHVYEGKLSPQLIWRVAQERRKIRLGLAKREAMRTQLRMQNRSTRSNSLKILTWVGVLEFASERLFGWLRRRGNHARCEEQVGWIKSSGVFSSAGVGRETTIIRKKKLVVERSKF